MENVKTQYPHIRNTAFTGLRVRLLRELKTRGGETFAQDEILVVEGCYGGLQLVDPAGPVADSGRFRRRSIWRVSKEFVRFEDAPAVSWQKDGRGHVLRTKAGAIVGRITIPHGREGMFPYAWEVFDEPGRVPVGTGTAKNLALARCEAEEAFLSLFAIPRHD